MKILTYSEDLELGKELLSAARGINQGDPVSAVLLGPSALQHAQEMARFGADQVYLSNHPRLTPFQAEPHVDALEAVAKTVNPSVILIGGTRSGKELAPRLSTRLRTGCISDCVGLRFEDRQLLMERVVYVGKAMAHLFCTTPPAVCTIRPHTFEKHEEPGRPGAVTSLELDLREPRSRIVGREERPKGQADLTQAKVIVSAGRGFKRKEDLALIQELADVLGGEVGCSRPLSSDLGWLSEEHHIGISGISVKPQLYLAVGISGQMHHLVGIRDSRMIAAINSDKNAPIFTASDYCVTGDLYQIVPELTKAFRKILGK